MHRSELFEGRGAPFEGERTVVVRSIPEGARLGSAVLTLTPVAAPGRPLFEETITFAGGTGTLGATQASYDPSGAGQLHWTELDFHQRRTVTRVVGTGLTGAEVQVDLGGVYLQLNQQGAPRAPGDTQLLTVGAGGELPGLTANKIKLTALGRRLPVASVQLRSTPSNLTLRAGSQPAFFSRPGELATPVTTPDAATALQAALAGAPVVDGFYELPLVVHSDTLCRLDVELSVEFTVAAPALPGGLAETTLTYDFSGAPTAPAATLAVPAGSRVVATASAARALGAFQATRVGYGPVGPARPAAALALTAGQALARPVTVAADLTATAADLLLAATTPTARLQLDVVSDTDGKPGNQPLLARPVEIAIEHGDDDAPHWVSAALPASFTLTAGTRYWLTLQAVSGEATWSAVAAQAAPSTQNSRDGGLSWRQASAPGLAAADALLRLRVVPDTFTMPVQLQVGDGAAAQRVSLERFAPLGRVEIDLNAPEIIGGINAGIAAAAAATCPTGEHIRNGDFAAWTRSADQPTGSRTLDAGFRVHRVAVARDCTAFAAGGADAPNGPGLIAPNLFLQLAAIDVFADDAGGAIPEGNARRLCALAADPGGQYAYVLVDGGAVIVLDLQTGRTATAALARRSTQAFAVSADGATLYVGAIVPSEGPSTYVLAALPAEAVRAAVVGAAPIEGPELDLGALRPVDIVATADGTALWVLGAGEASAALLRVDPGSFGLSGTPIPLAQQASRLAVSVGGSIAAAVHPATTQLSVVDLQAGTTQIVDLAAGDQPEPSAVALTADGHYAFVTLADAAAVALVDVPARRVLRRISVGAQPADCAITRDGERVFVADAVETADAAKHPFTVLQVGTLLPEDWVVTAGTVRPACVPPGGRVAVVGAPQGSEPADPPAATSAMAQVVPVAGGCRYELTFHALAIGDGATAELHWLGGGCSQLRTDTVPITAPASVFSRRAVVPLGLLPHRLLTDAPSDASQAELRVQAPPGVLAFADDVSLRATVGVLPNGALSLAGDVLEGWLVGPSAPSGFSAVATGGALVLGNAGGVPVTLAQQAPVRAGQSYQLIVDAVTDVAATGGLPSADIAWSAAGQPAGEPVSVPLTPGASRPVIRSVTPPAGSDSAEVRVVLEPGSQVRVTRVSLDAVTITTVPVTFVAEAPGELTLIGWQVGYDADDTVRVPPIPAGGLCRPGRPLPVPGEASGTCCYCPTCEGEHDMAGPRSAITGGGVPGTLLTCTNCGASVTLPGLAAADWPGPAGSVPGNPSRPHDGTPVRVTLAPDAARMLPPPPPALSVPLVAVVGIGPATAGRLNGLGILTMADLAASAPARVAALPGVTGAQARSWIEQARALIRPADSDQ
jgi:predicted flap endonuclease-1-like 5' DNA nuclease